MLAITFLRVLNDVELQTLEVDLEDVVRTFDDPNDRGKYRSLIVTLLNGEILDRWPEAVRFRYRPLPVTLDEFSNLKFQVMQKLRAWVRPSDGSAVQ